MAVSPSAATLTIGKILNDIKNGKTVSSADVLTVTGNIISLMGVVGVVVGATGPVALVATALAATLGILGIGFNENWFSDFDPSAPLCENGSHDYQNLNKDGKASRSPHETSNPDVGCVRNARGFCSNDLSLNAG